jgi:hypothetical protein
LNVEVGKVIVPLNELFVSGCGWVTRWFTKQQFECEIRDIGEASSNLELFPVVEELLFDMSVSRALREKVSS